MILNHQFEESTMLSNASYDTNSSEMTVIFTNGKPYTYIDVDQRLFNELISAKSAGSFFNRCKKDLRIKAA